MPRQVKRKEIDWTRASCLGIDTELFYSHRTGLIEQGLTLEHLRRVCMYCPIQRDCLTIGVAHEPFGFWGGLSEDERRDLHARRDTKILRLLRQDLHKMGLSYQKVVEHVQSVVRDFTYANERKYL